MSMRTQMEIRNKEMSTNNQIHWNATDIHPKYVELWSYDVHDVYK